MVVLMILLAWVLVSALTAAVACLLLRSGQQEDRMLGSGRCELVPAGAGPAPSPREQLREM